MYHLIKIFSYLIRQFCLPNPFTNLFKESGVAEIANWISGGVFIPLAYLLTRMWYDGSEPAAGSAGFLVNYAILTGLLLLITKFITNIYIVVIIFLIMYVLLCVLENKLLGDRY